MPIYASSSRVRSEGRVNERRTWRRNEGEEEGAEKKEPWRARRALGVNEGRSCDRSIFPKRQGGPIRRHVKAGRIISNLYCRGIRLRSSLYISIGFSFLFFVLLLRLLQYTYMVSLREGTRKLIPVSPMAETTLLE